MFLTMNPLCVHCLAAGRVVAATILDHVLSVSQRPDLEGDPDNWQALCKACSDIKTAQERRR